MAQRWVRALDAWLLSLSRGSILGLALFIGIAIGIVDYFVSPDLLVLYLAPLFISAWYGGPGPGYVTAVYAAAASFLTLTFISGSHEVNGTAIGNLAVRVAAYLAITHLFVRLRETQRQQEELVGFIIHDLRSPVSSAITGLSTLEQTSDYLTPEDRELVQLALVSNNRALTLVNSILDVAKMESGKMNIDWEEVDVAEFVHECFSHVALWAQGHGIKLDSDIDVEKATLDRTLTSRVMANLLSNALKFSPEGSVVSVVASPDHEGIRFTITDQGPGIPQEYAETIFDPFAQVKGTKGGTGLGLTFCRLAIHAQGGKIGVNSEVGAGSSFWFTIPKRH